MSDTAAAQADLGHLIDRLTIIARKMVEADLRGETRDWQDRLIDLSGHLPEGAGSVGQLIATLAAVNAAIWEREDRLRAFRACEAFEAKRHEVHEKAGELAFEITRLNDWRAELMREEKYRG